MRSMLMMRMNIVEKILHLIYLATFSVCTISRVCFWFYNCLYIFGTQPSLGKRCLINESDRSNQVLSRSLKGQRQTTALSHMLCLLPGRSTRTTSPKPLIQSRASSPKPSKDWVTSRLLALIGGMSAFARVISLIAINVPQYHRVVYVTEYSRYGGGAKVDAKHWGCEESSGRWRLRGMRWVRGFVWYCHRWSTRGWTGCLFGLRLRALIVNFVLLWEENNGQI